MLVRRRITRLLRVTACMFLALATEEARAQQSPKLHQIGYLITGSPAESANRVKALRTGLEDHGYVEGKNITLVFRSAETADRLPEAAADLVRLNVDVIFATSSTELEAARRATRTIPIVFATHGDPEGVGHVASLARPGGHITGLSMIATELAAKELEIMKQALPHITRVGLLLTMTVPSHRLISQAAEVAALRLGIQVLAVPVRTRDDLPGAFATMERERVHGVLAVPTPLTRAQRARLAELSLRHPSAGHVRDEGERGGRGSHELRAGSRRPDPPRRDLHRQDPQGCQTSRPTSRTGCQIRARHQPQDGQGARLDDPVVAAAAGG